MVDPRVLTPHQDTLSDRMSGVKVERRRRCEKDPEYLPPVSHEEVGS